MPTFHSRRRLPGGALANMKQLMPPAILSEDVQVRAAVGADAQALTELAFRAKAHWQYPKEWMEAWRSELTVTAEYIAQHRVVAAHEGSRIVAFYGIEFRDKTALLEHLWVDPAETGTGLGRRLFRLACDDARDHGCVLVELVADPNAEGFYLRQGASRVGEVVGEVLGVPRVLPRMRMVLSGERQAESQ